MLAFLFGCAFCTVGLSSAEMVVDNEFFNDGSDHLWIRDKSEDILYLGAERFNLDSKNTIQYNIISDAFGNYIGKGNDVTSHFITYKYTEGNAYLCHLAWYGNGCIITNLSTKFQYIIKHGRIVSEVSASLTGGGFYHEYDWGNVETFMDHQRCLSR